MKPLVIGYGNSLRGDDGAGPYAARLLQNMNDEGGWDIVACHQLTPELAETISRASLVISKGDANYRRLLGDAHWDPATPFAQAVAYFLAPLVALRTRSFSR